MLKKLISLAFLIILGLSSCSHDEGYGGLATIKGKIYGQNYNNSGTLVNQGYLGGVKVYISQHNNPSYFDSMDSAYDGTFKFDYLYTGTYDIWVYGDCDYCSWDQIYVLKTIKINSKKAKVVTEDFIVAF
ncbi:MAG: hypothetical protein NT048_07225 [Flavobacterium sp.]|nr:hypothetical protein [Flavobacterium sp.]